MANKLLDLDGRTTVAANVLILLWLAWAYFLSTFYPDLYYLTVQEDEYLEWGTFWAFFLASILFAVAAWRQYRVCRRFPWFLLGVSLFCFLVAGEEISWAQRVIGYRPPTYFLEDNFQQELNIHNVFGTTARKFTVRTILLGYGVLLPLLAVPRFSEKLLRRFLIVAPPLHFIPAFLTTFVFYYFYALDYTGETAELMMGLAFAFCGLAAMRDEAGDDAAFIKAGARRLPVSSTWALLLLLGVGTASGMRAWNSGSPEKLAQARLEVASLSADFMAIAKRDHHKYATSCNRHKRIYSYERKYGMPELYKGVFASLVRKGVPEERARFFLDPCNAPYWIRDRCAEDGKPRVVFVYSFGPNRKRDSTRREILGDDIGSFIKAQR